MSGLGVGVNRRAFLKSSVALGVGIGVTGLGACGGGATSPAAAGAPYTGQISVPLYKQLPDNAAILIAMERKLFAKYDLNMNIVDLTQGTDVVRSTVSQTKLGDSSLISEIVAVESGFPGIRIVGTALGRVSVQFLVPPDSAIKSIPDLRGKKIGVNAPASLTTYLAEQMLRDAGLDPKADVELVNVKGISDSATALANGVVDCSWSSAPLSVQIVAQNKARMLVDTGELFPDFIQSTLFTTTEFLESQGDVVGRWIAAIRDAQALIREDVATAAGIWGKAIGIDDDVARTTLLGLQAGFDIKVSRPGYEQGAKAAMTMGLVKRIVPYDEIVVDRYATQT